MRGSASRAADSTHPTARPATAKSESLHGRRARIHTPLSIAALALYTGSVPSLASLPLLVLAQLNRQAEASKDNRPKLSHLRESGAIEQDADVVMFVHREEYYRHGEEKKELEGQAEIIIAKQRNGPVDDVKVRWLKDFTRFVNAAPDNMVPDFESFNQPGEASF